MCLFPSISQPKCAKKSPSSITQPVSARYIEDPLSRIQYPIAALPPTIAMCANPRKHTSHPSQPLILIPPPPHPTSVIPPWDDIYSDHHRSRDHRHSSLLHEIDMLQALSEKFTGKKEKEGEKGIKEEMEKLRTEFNKKVREDEVRDAVGKAKAEGAKIGGEEERERRKRESAAVMGMGMGVGFAGLARGMSGGLGVDGEGVRLHLHRHVLDGGRGVGLGLEYQGGVGMGAFDGLGLGRGRAVDPYEGAGSRLMLDRVRSVEIRQDELDRGLDRERERERDRERERERMRNTRWGYP